MQRMIQGRGNKSIPYRMLLTKLFKHLKIELSEEVVSECHEKSIIGKQFVERLLPKKKKKDVGETSKSKRKTVMMSHLPWTVN